MNLTGGFLPHISTFLSQTNVYTWLSLVAALVFMVRSYVSEPFPVDTPLIGKRSKYEPLFWVRLRFFQEGWPMIREGYRRVSYFLDDSSFGIMELR